MKTISRVSFFFLVTMFVLSVFVLIFLETQLLLAQNFGDVESREWREKYHVNDSLSIKYLKGEISGKGSGRKPFLRAFDSYYKRANSNGEIPTNYLWQQNELLNQTFPGFGTVSNGKGGNSLNDAANWQEVGTGQLLQLSVDLDGDGSDACDSGTLFSQTGRITSLAIDPTNANILYAGSASGGIWKTTNGGGSWFSSWNNIPNCSIGAIALRPGNPNEILVGTGENGGSGLSFGGFNGIGLVKSTDGGASWTQVPSLSAGYSGGLAFYRVAYNPANPNRILCATNQGLRLSTDNGTSWTSLTCSPAGSLPGFAVNSNASDVIVNPVDASKVVASFWGIGMFFSSDSGNTWSASNINSNSTMNIGRIKLCWVTAAGYTNQAYAVIANSSNSQLLGLYKTTNFGQTWSLASTDTDITGNQSWYAMAIMTDRGDANTLYVGGLDLYSSDDSGGDFDWESEWTALKDLLNDDDDYVHADQHVIIQHPTDHNTFFIGCDGGV
ncbi:exo-alpha-sialidase, partial [bacterium]|nr:exo-alpha-sialidase [bacterium]